MSNAASEIARLRAELVAQTARTQAAERDLAQARALASCTEAMIQELKLKIPKLLRDKYGTSSERRARLIDQLELQLEELEAAATEDALAAAAADKTNTVRALVISPFLTLRDAHIFRYDFPSRALDGFCFA